MRHGSTKKEHNRVYAWPFGIAIATIAGLAAALVGDGIFDRFSWATLLLPAAVILFALLRNRVACWRAPAR